MGTFEDILSQPASSIKPPEAYPTGEYVCLIVGPPERDKSSQKQTDLLRFKYQILSYGKGVDVEKATEMQLIGKTITEDYYITENAKWRLKDMLMNAGIDPGGEPGTPTAKGLDMMVSEAPGKSLLVTLKHEMSQDGKRIFSRVASTGKVV